MRRSRRSLIRCSDGCLSRAAPTLAGSPGFGPTAMRASTTLENPGSEEHVNVATQAHARSRSFASSEKPIGCLSEGRELPEVLEAFGGIAEATYHRWRNQYGGMKADDVRRLKELEGENQKLKRIVADQALDIQRRSRRLSAGNF